jgi:hypothetical protein
VDDPALLQQGKTDIAFCHANLDAGAADEAARECMAQKRYALVQKDQAEEARSAGIPFDGTIRWTKVPPRTQ